MVQQYEPERGVQSGGAELCRGVVEPAAADRARSPASGAANMLEAVRIVRPAARYLSGVVVGDVRARSRSRCRQSETTPFYPRSPVRRGETLCALDDGELSRELRAACLVGHPVQPRKSAARDRVRHPQGDRRGGADQARPGEPSCRSATWRPHGTGAMRADYVRGDVADAAAGQAADDYVVATGRTTTIRELCRIAFAHAGLEL